MLWTNLIMDSLGALALATERPSAELLQRRPYRRDAPLVSAPMVRNILCQAAYQLCVLYLVLFRGHGFFNASPRVTCQVYSVDADVTASIIGTAKPYWDPFTGQASRLGLDASYGGEALGCDAFAERCPLVRATNAFPSSQTYLPNFDCYQSSTHIFVSGNLSSRPSDDASMRLSSNGSISSSTEFTFSGLEGFADSCLLCEQHDYTLNTIVFNAFIFCQVFNEINSRKLFNEINVFEGLHKNYLFLSVLLITIAVQYVIITFGGDFSNTSPLGLREWFVTVLLGSGSLIVGVLQRLLPVREGKSMFADCEGGGDDNCNRDDKGLISAAEKNPLI